ncbi:MAG: Rrf2 family transcriptional regulator [Sphingobacteriaceae bacterium]|jgi:Rrf2 family protein|nr:Rrf2 family transcriptional regulator [Sphingobacteriaceae bacterium]
MLLSKSCEYAIRASIYIAAKTAVKKRADIREIADAIGSPISFTAKVLQKLSCKQLISSVRGPNGGYYIKDPLAVYLVDIVRAIDGNDLFSACAMGLQTCSDTKPCPMHHDIKPLRAQLLTEFSKASVGETSADYWLEKYFLK